MLMRMGQGGSVVSYFLFFLEFQPSQWYSEPNVLTSHALIKKIMRCNRMMQSTTKLRKHEEKYLCAFMHFLFFFTLKNFFCTQMTSNQVNVSKPGKFIRSSLPKKYIVSTGKRTSWSSVFFSSLCELDAEKIGYDWGVWS